MIYDKLINMGLYKGMNKNLDTAIDFILSHDLNELPMGKTVIDGDNVYINIMDAKAQPVEERAYEIHKNYMDIQMDLVGIERIDTGDCTRMTPGEYNETKDVAKATAEDLAGCIIGPENFIVCMPNEPHKPNIAVTDDVVLKKAVCKVHI